jgi:integrase
MAKLSALAPGSRASLFSAVKVFSKYLAMFNSTSYVIRRNPFRKPPARRAYIFTRGEVDGLLREAIARRSRSPVSHLNHYMIIGLLAFTGLRTRECLNLNVEDWREKSSELFVRRGKFGKDRVIPVNSSVKEKMTFFIRRRGEFGEFSGDAPLFLGARRSRVYKDCFYKVFSELLDKCGIDRDPPASRPPTIHSLRHTFAVNNIIKWVRQGKDVNAMLPYLSRYMGHVGVASTQVYLQSVEELRRAGAEKFHQLFTRCVRRGDISR